MGLAYLRGALGWRPGTRAGRFIAYFHLVDACGKPGCPVCRCLREAAARSLDALLYERVTDPATRERLRASWGFCAWHAGLAREGRNASLGLAILCEDLLRLVREQVSATRRELTGVGGWRRRLRRRRPLRLVRVRAGRRGCPLCQLLAEAEVGYLDTLLEYIEDPEFDGAYERSAGLCLPHLARALERHPGHAGVGPLLLRTERKLEGLARDLRGFIEKHDYRRAAPFADSEATSWTDALALLAGEPGLFGHEIPRPGGPLAAGPVPPGDVGAAAPSPAAEPLEERVQALLFEKERLEERLRQLAKQLGDQSSRAAALHYRLWATSEDRKVLEMNLAGERAAARLWEAQVQALRAEVAELRARLARYEPPPADAR